MNKYFLHRLNNNNNNNNNKKVLKPFEVYQQSLPSVIAFTVIHFAYTVQHKYLQGICWMFQEGEGK